ncbi:MAG: SUMF1/EgtB/PvdO family nonheme iron enzyme [Patescibacteria group bacterium]|nr:SUMF1/EgtB/PvdO family nonheme iron enzyme [Patescibacteria group bacterium]
MTSRSGVCWAALCALFVQSAPADMFGTGANQFTIDFVPISAATNPASGYGIVNYDYHIGVYEITNDQWNKFAANLGVPVAGNPSSAYDDAFNDWGTGTTDVPTNRVSWYETAQFVNWLNTSTGHQAAYKFTGTQGQSDYAFTTWDAADAWGGTNLYRHKDAYYFLPDEDEWVKAAYWNAATKTIQDYATKPGDTLHQGDGTSGTGWNYHHGGYATNPNGPWNVGTGSEELNGTYDMMGNNWEWVESAYSDANSGAGSSRGVRGGGWRIHSGHLLASNRSSLSPTDEDSYLGFRVASVIPEPASATILLMGAVGLLLWRRRRNA